MRSLSVKRRIFGSFQRSKNVHWEHKPPSTKMLAKRSTVRPFYSHFLLV